MHQIVGVEPVVAQVVVEDFVCGEIVNVWKTFRQLFSGQTERGFAHGVARQ